MWEKSTGLLRYSPKLLGERSSDKWWLVLDCDSEIGRYFRHLYFLHVHGVDKMVRPAWQEHITVIRDEEPPDDKKALWGKYDGRSIDFSYKTEPRTNGEYWWLDVECEFLLTLREELGLLEPECPLHLSIGHNKGD